MTKGGMVYILTNKNKTTLYVGVTAKPKKRIWEHRTNKFKNSFTSRYILHHLVYYEGFHSIEEAIAREKEIKGKKRIYKEELITTKNPNWDDLWEEVLG